MRAETINRYVRKTLCAGIARGLTWEKRGFGSSMCRDVGEKRKQYSEPQKRVSEAIDGQGRGKLSLGKKTT